MTTVNCGATLRSSLWWKCLALRDAMAMAAAIRNRNTRMAYYQAVVRFLAWCDQHRLAELVAIASLHVAAYIEALDRAYEKPLVKQHLAAIRRLFDWLVKGSVVATNPAHAVRGPTHIVRRGKTPVLAGGGDEALQVRDARAHNLLATQLVTRQLEQ